MGSEKLTKNSVIPFHGVVKNQKRSGLAAYCDHDIHILLGVVSDFYSWIRFLYDSEQKFPCPVRNRGRKDNGRFLGSSLRVCGFDLRESGRREFLGECRCKASPAGCVEDAD